MRFIYLSPANRVHSLYLSECADSSHIPALEVLGLKADIYPTVSLWRENTKVIERSGERESEWQKVKGGRQRDRERERERERERRGRKRNECRLNPGTSGNVIPISIEAPLWSYERERSHTVLLSSLSLVLWLNYLWKTSIEGMWWVKGFFTNNTKSKKAPRMDKKMSHQP